MSIEESGYMQWLSRAKGRQLQEEGFHSLRRNSCFFSIFADSSLCRLYTDSDNHFNFYAIPILFIGEENDNFFCMSPGDVKALEEKVKNLFGKYLQKVYLTLKDNKLHIEVDKKYASVPILPNTICNYLVDRGYCGLRTFVRVTDLGQEIVISWREWSIPPNPLASTHQKYPMMRDHEHWQRVKTQYGIAKFFNTYNRKASYRNGRKA